MRSTKDNSLLAAATIMALSATPVELGLDASLGSIPRTSKAAHKPRSKSTHKQNARKARKGRK